jgi:hypothetical protein
MRRYPLQPLLDALHVDQDTVKGRLGLDHRQVTRYVNEGLTERRAEELAVQAGIPPLNVWPEMEADAFADHAKECASADCPVRFVPRDARGQQRYCSDTCRNREKIRRYRATPKGAAKARRYRRTYYWSDPRIRQREAELKAKPAARRAEARRARERRAERRDAA